MALISQQIPVITGGVSREPQARRSSSRAQESINTLLSHSRRISKRPPLEHLLRADIGVEFRTILPPKQGPNGATIVSESFIVHPGDLVWVDVGWKTPAETLDSVVWDADGVNEALVQISDIAGASRRTAVWISQFTDVLTPKTATFTATFSDVVDDPVIRVFSLKGVFSEIHAVDALDTDTGADLDDTLSTSITSTPGGGTPDVPASRRLVVTSSLEVNSAPTFTPTAPTTVVDEDDTADWGFTLLSRASAAPAVTAGTYSGNPGGFHAVSLEVYPLAESVTDAATFDVDGTSYLVVFQGAGIRVFNVLSGAEMEVRTPYGTAYLQGATNYRTVPIGDALFIINQAREVAQELEVAPQPEHVAYVTVNAGAAGTTYTILLDEFPTNHVVSPSATLDDTRTDVIAEELTVNINTGLSSLYFSATRDGSTIRIVSLTGASFSVSASDGLGDNGMTAVKDSVRRFEDLPQKVDDGTVLEIEGSDTTPLDNYFTKFTKLKDSLQRRGTWKECVRPGSLLRLDRFTMPHKLQFRGPTLESRVYAGEGPIPQLLDSVMPVVSWQFPASELYPAGSTQHWTFIDEATETTIEFEYNISVDGPETGAEVATGLAAVIDAHGEYESSSPSSGVLQVTRADAADFRGGPTPEPNKTAFHCMAPTDFLPDDFVGSTIRNLTTGSTAVISSNTEHTIIHSELSVGADGRDYWLPGDLAEIRENGNYFVFAPCPWKDREAGDDTTVPFPSFVGKTITDVFLYEGRLGFLSGSNVVFSRSGDRFNLFKKSAIDLRTDDPIDISNALPDSSSFHAGRNWRGGLVLFTELAQYRVRGDPILSPQSISLTQLSSYANLADVAPVVSGDKLFFISIAGGDPKLVEYQIQPASDELPKAVDLTEHIPGYIEGSPVEIVADDTLGFLFLLTDTGNTLYVCSYRDSDGNLRGERAWCRWEFPIGVSLIGGLAINRGLVGVIATDPSGAYVNSITLNGTDPFLDRLISSASLEVSADYDAIEDETTWTLPYEVATDGSEGNLMAADAASGNSIGTTRPAANQIRAAGDLTAASLVFGVAYEMSHTLSTIFQRNRQTGEAEQRGRLQLHYLSVSYEDTNRFVVEVTPDGRNMLTYIFFSEVLTPPVETSTGKLRVPILCRNDKVTIVLTDAGESLKPLHLTHLDWIGNYTAPGARL